MPIKVGDIIFPVDFIVLHIGENQGMSVILGKPFLVTGRALLDFETCKLILKVEDKQQSFTVNIPLKQSTYLKKCNKMKTKERMTMQVILTRRVMVD